MTQPSTSAAANSGHDVFINHRGPDSKKTFASHLYRRLLSSGLTVFLDQPELQRGDDFSVQIEQEIRSASVHVAIFSERYAESRWCLDELVQMLDTKAPIIPVFYHVKPDELRGTRGKKRTYAEALDEQAKKTDYDGQTPRHDPSKIQKWRNALCEVANRSGFELEACNGDEGELLDQVVDEVLKRVKKVALPRDVGKYPTGLDEKVEDFEKILLQQQQSGKPQILGIVGLGGIGKTTLATEFFNRKRSDYSRSCFFSDVKDNVKNKDLIKLQKILLDMFNVPSEEINRVTDVAEGKEMIRKHISSSFKALLVIDDVDHDDQVDALLPHTSEIHPDSLILITSRNRQVLRNSNVEEESIYTLSGLSKEHSLELFCSYSFHRSRPPQEFESLVNDFLETCDGLPLSLKVFGALLHRKKTSYWKDQLYKLGHTLPNEIMERLKISYNALEEDEKAIFLDTACFFIGEDRDMVIRILGEGFQNLEDRCLVEVDHEKKIKIHDHLRDMGRELAKGSGLPRRLWRWTEEDHDDLLRESSNGQMTAVRGVRIVYGEDEGEDDELHCAHTEIDEGIRMSSLQLLDAEGDLMQGILKKVSYPKLKWLRWTEGEFSSLPDSLPPSIPMKHLRVLQIEGTGLKTLWKEESQAPLELRELEIEAPLSHIPNSIGQLNHLERIVIGSVLWDQRVFITELPEEFCLLRSLKVLVLEEWSEMKALPKCFGKLTELQHIELHSCTALERLPESFGNLTNLHHLRLKMCPALEWLPESFGKLTNLQHIDLSDCWDLKRLPDSLGELKSLKYLGIEYCEKLKCLPTYISRLTQLTELNVLQCPLIRELPLKEKTLNDFQILPGLQKLKVSETGISEVSFAEGVCCNLRSLSIVSCNNLVKVGRLPNTLIHLSFSDCKELEELPSIETLISLSQLHTCRCVKLKHIGSLGQLTKLQYLNVESCSELEELEGIQHCIWLRILTASGCVKLKHIGALGQLTKLQYLTVEGCAELEALEGIQHCICLRKLAASGCVKLKHIGSLGQLTKLQYLNVKSCAELEELEGIQHCICLRELNASGCVKLKHIGALGQ